VPAVAGRAVVRVAADLGPALLVYAAVRVLGVVVLDLMAAANGLPGTELLQRWDGVWLVSVAEGGYDTRIEYDSDGLLVRTNAAFFPLLPGLMAGVSALTGWAATTSGFVVVAVAGLAAAAGLDRIGRHVVGGRWAGLILVALWASWPHGVVLSMIYTEALFVALAAWTLYAALRERWLWAGALSLLAGTTRPTGTALAAVVVLCALAAVVRRRGTWRPLAGALLAPLGFLGFWWWLGRETGRTDAWFLIQREGWGSTFDGGRFTWDTTLGALTRPTPLVLTLCALIVLACLALLIALFLQGTPLPLLLYSALVLYMTVGAAGYPHSKPRFLLTAFPLLIPLVRALAAGPRRTTAVLLATIALASAWYGAYLLVLWHSSP
jgi:hypothetical protein